MLRARLAAWNSKAISMAWSALVVISSTQPCLWRLYAAFALISAVILTTPAILAAFGCAPDMPPKPAVTKSLPSGPPVDFMRAAFKTVMVVPCTMPCGPIYM